MVERRRRDRERGIGPALLVVLALAFAWLCADAAPSVRLIDRDVVRIEAQPLTAALVVPGEDTLRLEVDGVRGADVRTAVRWPDERSITQLVLRAAPSSPRPGASHVRLDSEVTLSGGTVVRASRSLLVADTATALFEVARQGELALTLVLRLERIHSRVLAPVSATGLPVQLKLEIERVDAGRNVLLETNRLNTFVGEPVSYSFRLGAGGGAESVRVQLTPLQIEGELLRLAADVSGTLPDGEQRLIVSREEQWLGSSGATSSLSVVQGEPPTGYRFLVTPFF